MMDDRATRIMRESAEFAAKLEKEAEGFALLANRQIIGVFKTPEFAEAAMIAFGAQAMKRVGFVPEYEIKPIVLPDVAAWLAQKD